MKNKDILEQIGLTKDESTIYRTLLSVNPISISEIVRKTGIHRPTVYKTLPSLLEKQLVSVMPKGKNKLYVAESPERVEKIFEELEDEFNSEINTLFQNYKVRDKKPLVKYAEGDSAIKNVFSDVVHSLDKNESYYRYSSALNLARKKYVPKDYRAVRDKKDLNRYIITDSESLKISSKKLGKSMKSIPKDSDLFELDITQIIYGNKVSLIDYNSKTIVTIENEMIARFQEKIFKLLFGRL
jgi:sugar-specific transcriptional regulator TrmB